MKIIGITGPSGSGKTTLSKILTDSYNAIIIDADAVAKKLSNDITTEYYKEIVKLFGEGALQENNQLNRKKIASIIYSDKEKKEELSARFTEDFILRAQRFDQMLSVMPEAAAAVKSGVKAMHDVTEGGIFGALWELAESSGVGLEIELKKIPLKQETVEICEFFGINPYGLISSGAMLMASNDGSRLVMYLKKAGIAACIIGKAK